MSTGGFPLRIRWRYLQQLFTHSMKFAVLEPVRSAMVCPWPQTVSKSTSVTPLAAASASARLISVALAVSPYVMPVRMRQ